MTPRWTAPQRTAIDRRDTDLCVVAGAGSGKTSVLAERFVALVLDAGDHAARLRTVDRVLAITFTEKAATEMRERVARRLLAEGEARAARAPGDAVRLLREAQELRRAVETAWVTTFHAFCARVLKENAIEAGVDPAFGVLDESDAEVLLEEAMAEAVERMAAVRPEAVRALAGLGAASLGETLPTLLARCRDRARRPSRALAGALRAPDAAPALAAARAAVAGLDFPDAGSDAWRSRVEACKAAVAALATADTADAGAVAAAARALRRGADRRGMKGERSAALLRVQEAADGVHAVSVALRAVPVARALGLLLDLIARGHAARRRARGLLDFQDLESHALRLLRTDAAVAGEVRDRFDHLLVDEVQDTSPVQEALLAALRAGREGRCFAVGDPKQAIYGFRGADVRVFQRERARVAPRGEIVLQENFRSRAGILAFANAMLAPAFAAGGAAQVPYEPLLPGAPHGPRSVPSVELLVVAGGDGGGMEDARAREARALAARLTALVGGPEALATTRLDAAGAPEARPLRWGDVAVLLRATSDIQVLERALADHEIPFQVVKGRGFFEAREVVDLAHLLAALENPRDEFSLAVALRSPFAGLDDDALLAATVERDRRRRAGDREARLGDLLDRGAPPPPGLPAAMRRRWRRFADVRADLLDLRRHGRLHEIVDAALRRTGYDLAVLLRPRGRQAAANLRKVRERARRFEAAGLGGLREFAALLRRLRLREERETEAPLDTEDAVSLLTVHAAKGLEWPLVVVPDLARRSPAVTDPVLLGEDSAGLRLRTRDGTEATPEWNRLRDEEHAFREAESVRLLHVAVTRAREYLLLSAGLRAGDARLAAGGGAAPTDHDGDDGDVDGHDGDAPAAGRRAVPWLDRVLATLPGGALPGASGVVAAGDAAAGGPVDLLVRRVDAADTPPAAGRRSLAAERRRRLLAGRGPGVRAPGDARRAAVERVASVRALAVPDVRDGTPYLASVSALLDFLEDPARHHRLHVLGIPDRAPAALPGVHGGDGMDAGGDDAPPSGPARREARPGDEDELPAAGPPLRPVPQRVRGVVAHAALGLLSFEDLADGGRLRAFVADRLREEMQGPADPDVVAGIARAIEGFLASPLGGEVRAAAARGPDRVRREEPFLLRLRPPDGGHGLLLRGQIDLAFEDAAGAWVVADYKAGGLGPGRRARRRYALQVGLYAAALREAGVPAPSRALLVPLCGDAPEPVPAMDADAALAVLRPAVARFLAAVR